MRKHLLIWFMMGMLFSLAISQTPGDLTRKQETRRQIQFLIELNNACQYFQKGKPDMAMRILDRLYQRYPDNERVNYLLSILYYHYLGDLVAYKDFFNRAYQLNPSLTDPQLLDQDAIRKVFAPRNLNEASVNLLFVLITVDERIQRKSFDEARMALQSARPYLQKADPAYLSRYHLYAAITYQKLDSLFRAAKHYLEIQPQHLEGTDFRRYEDLKSSMDRFIKKFHTEFRSPKYMLSYLHRLYRKREYRQILDLVDLLLPRFQLPSRYYWPLQIYRLKAYEGLGDIRTGIPFYKRLKALMEERFVWDQFEDEVNRIWARLSLLATQRKIGRQSARADSLMLRGQYASGRMLYEQMLDENREDLSIVGYLYYQLSRVHTELGRYRDARRYLGKSRRKEFNEILLDSLSKYIDAAEAFEKEWNRTREKVEKYIREGNLQLAKGLALTMLVDPRLRYGLKEPTLLLMAEIYRKMGRISWAQEMVRAAIPFSIQPDSLLRIDSTLAAYRQKNYINHWPERTHAYQSLKLLYRNNVEMRIYPLADADIAGGAVPLQPILAFSNQEVDIRGGHVYLVEFDEEVFWQKVLATLGVMGFAQFYLTFR
ncbi:MAG: hypothetical protein GXO78_05765 [Calditrichaeota bacterium]|nr:hypothetical protein [Calditrichota bacterium]